MLAIAPTDKSAILNMHIAPDFTTYGATLPALPGEGPLYELGLEVGTLWKRGCAMEQASESGAPHSSPQKPSPERLLGAADTKRRSPINFYDKPIQFVVKNLRYKSGDPRRARESSSDKQKGGPWRPP